MKRSTLQQAEQWLQSQPMLKISRSCLVNMSDVREISQTPRDDAILVLAGGTPLPAAKATAMRCDSTWIACGSANDRR